MHKVPSQARRGSVGLVSVQVPQRLEVVLQWLMFEMIDYHFLPTTRFWSGRSLLFYLYYIFVWFCCCNPVRFLTLTLADFEKKNNPLGHIFWTRTRRQVPSERKCGHLFLGCCQCDLVPRKKTRNEKFHLFYFKCQTIQWIYLYSIVITQYLLITIFLLFLL